MKHIQTNMTVMPHFSFPSVTEQVVFTDKQFSKGNVIINYFSPDCDHCQFMARTFYINRDKLKNTNILMISAQDRETTESFIKEYALDSITNVKVLLNDKNEFFTLFGTSIIPSFFIYKDSRLIKKVTGETKIDNLLPND